MANSKNNAPLLPAYLVVGEDELKRETVLKRLDARLSTMGDLSFNFDRFQGESATGEEIVGAANTLPFASEVRLVRVDRVERLKKADSEQLVTYLENPAQTTVLLLIADKLAKNTRLYKAIAALGKTAIIDCPPQNRRDLGGTVMGMARSHGVQLTPGAANALIDLVGTNTVALDSEVRKLSLAHRGSDAINENEVFTMVSRTAEVKPWEFVDSFAGRNLERCLVLLNKMNGSTSAYALLSFCTSRIRELITAKALLARGESKQLAKVLKVPDWRVKNHMTWARNYRMEELIGALASACTAEQSMKSGGDPDTVFLDWLIVTLRR